MRPFYNNVIWAIVGILVIIVLFWFLITHVIGH